MADSVQTEHHIINDPAFDIIPKDSTFFIIWRVEQMKLNPIPKEDYGKFYNGDSYIVACGTEFKERGDSQMESHPLTGELYIHIHFWIGSKSSMDEAGVAAIKAVEMDDYLGGSPVQHRETEGHESQRFLSYFKKGIRVLVGGVASGFHKVDFTIKPALFQVKGKRNPIVKEIPEINWLPFNDGDIFILATGKYIFVWTGKHASNMEKVKAIRIAESIRAEHSHYCESIVIVDDDEEELDLSADELQAFEKFLPLDKKCVDSCDPNEDETKYEQRERADVVLYQCKEENGAVSFNKVKNGPLLRSDLDSNDTFIVDNDVDGIWVWVGKKASRKEKSSAMKYANQLIKDNNYSPKTKISKVIEGSELIQFVSLFKSWGPAEKINVDYSRGYVGRVAKVVADSVDMNSVKDNHRLSAETQLVDDGNGDKKCYYLSDSQLLTVKEQHWGKFYKQNCYVIVYKYNSEKSIIYYWFGSESTQEDRDLTQSKAFDIDSKQFSGKSVMVRVVECSEPIHLMLIFHGLLTVYKGRYDPNSGYGIHLLQVKGTTKYNTKAVEVELNASSLNSNCVFVLTLPDKNFIWSGTRSFGDKREMATNLATNLDKDTQKDTQLVVEGEEPDDFWEALGGKVAYDSTKVDKLIHDFQMARLFEWRRNKFEEIVQFEQKDLDDDDVIILDAFDVLFIWLGKKVKDKYSTKAVKIVEEFIRKDVQKRTTDLPIYVIRQFSEPTNFTGFFNKWCHKHWDKNENFDDVKREMRKLFMKKFPVK